MGITVKICGLNDEAAVRAAVSAGVDFAGFVYYPNSPRHIPLKRAAELKSSLPLHIKSVCVLVDPDDVLLAEVQFTLAPDYVQLHGKESQQRLREIRKKIPDMKIIKAISVKSGDDIASAGTFFDVADMLMFDAKPPANMLPGGNALSFDWALLSGRSFKLPWFLSGGLNPENVAEAIRISGATMVDVSSGVERERGVKDAGLIAAFIKEAKP